MIDFNLDAKGIDDCLIKNEEDLIKQQIDVLFSSKYRELIGKSTYGVDHDQFLFDLTLSNEAIAYNISLDISSINTFDYKYDVDVSLLEGTQNDIMVVSINFYKNNKSFEKTYVIK